MTRSRWPFLEALKRGASISAAARVAGVHRRTAHRWRQKNANFAKACRDAMDEGTDELEDVRTDHARNGTDKPIHHMGVIKGTYKVFDHDLALRILEARRADVWTRRAKAEFTGANGGAIAVAQIARTIVDPGDEG